VLRCELRSLVYVWSGAGREPDGGPKFSDFIGAPKGDRTPVSALRGLESQSALGATSDFIRSRLALYSILHRLRGDQAGVRITKSGIRTRDTEFASF